MILVPEYVARREREEAGAAREQRAKADRVATIKSMTEEMRKAVPVTEDVGVAIYALCSRLLNRSRFACDPTLTPQEMGQFISDVLLGPGVGYEIKC